MASYETGFINNADRLFLDSRHGLITVQPPSNNKVEVRSLPADGEAVDVTDSGTLTLDTSVGTTYGGDGFGRYSNILYQTQSGVGTFAKLPDDITELVDGSTIPSFNESAFFTFLGSVSESKDSDGNIYFAGVVSGVGSVYVQQIDFDTETITRFGSVNPADLGTDLTMVPVTMPPTSDGYPRFLVVKGTTYIASQFDIVEVVYNTDSETITESTVISITDANAEDYFGGTVFGVGNWSSFVFNAHTDLNFNYLILGANTSSGTGAAYSCINLSDYSVVWNNYSTDYDAENVGERPTGQSFTNGAGVWVCKYETDGADEVFHFMNIINGTTLGRDTVTGQSVTIRPWFVMDYVNENFIFADTFSTDSLKTVVEDTDISTASILSAGADPGEIRNSFSLRRGPLPTSLNGYMEALNANLDGLIDSDDYEFTETVSTTVDLNGHSLTNLPSAAGGLQIQS